MSDPKTALAAFKTWFSSVGGFINPACELIYTAHAGVTLRVKKDYVGVFPAGEVAISCPHGVSLSALNAADLAPWAGLHTTHDTSRRLEAQENSNVKPLLALPTNIIRNARPQFVAAVWIAVQYLLGDESPWKPYFSILPGLPHDDENNAGDIGTKRGLGELDTPLWWSRGERLWLQGTNLAKGIADLEEVWDEEWKKWEGVIGEWGRSRGLVIEWQLTRYALTLLGSRAFSSSQTISSLQHIFPPSNQPQTILSIYNPDMLLYPGVDSLNHNPLTQNIWRSDENGFGIVVRDELRSGMEVYNPYGGKSNGELLLSYGFCIENNPCDSFAIKLPPAAPPLLQLIRQARPGDSTTTSTNVSISTESDQNILPTSSTSTTTPMTPHNRPVAHNLAHNTFFIRHSSRRTWNEDGYPVPPRSIPVETTETPSSALKVALQGFPKLLLTTLSATLVTPHEAALVSVNPAAFSPERLYTQLGNRNRLALINLLAQRLRLELARLPMIVGDLDESESEKRRMRKYWTNMYLTGQIGILESNIGILEAGLVSALVPSMINGIGNVPEVLTLATAFQLLSSWGSEYGIAVLQEIALVHGVESTEMAEEVEKEQGDMNSVIISLVEQLRALEVEEDVWVVWIGVVVQFLRENEDGSSESTRGRMMEWCSFIQSAYGIVLPEDTTSNGTRKEIQQVEEQEDAEEEEDIAVHILTVVDALRANAQSTSSVRLWSAQFWTRDFARACATVVQMESLHLNIANGSRLGRGLQSLEYRSETLQHEQMDGREYSNMNGEGARIVGLFIGTGMGRS